MAMDLTAGEVLEALDRHPYGLPHKVRTEPSQALDDEEMRGLRAELALNDAQQREIEMLIERHREAEAAAPSEAVRQQRKLRRIAFQRILLLVILDRTELASALTTAKICRGEYGED